MSEIEFVARAVMPKFYHDDFDLDAWRMFNSSERRMVVMLLRVNLGLAGFD